jgi:hypothetical protein
MAFKHGKAAEITVASVALSTFCDSADLAIDIDTADTSAFGASWKTALAGLAGGKLDLKGKWDPTTTSGPASALTALIGDAPFAVIYEPGGAASNQSRTFNAILTSYAESSPVGGIVAFTAGLLIDGAVTFES